MPRRETHHEAVRSALVAEGWSITSDPLRLQYGGVELYVDLGAERLLAAERGNECTAVEVKSFVGQSDIAESYGALGQYLSYRQVTFPRAAGHPLGTTPHSVAEAGGGVIVCDLRDVGWWKRQVTGDEMTVSLALASDITPDQRDEAMAAAEHLATFAGHQLQVDLHR